MKKLIAFLLSVISISVTAMEQPQVEDVDPIIVQVHELKAKQSKLAPFHEKNSFLDAYMNPSSFTELSATQLCFPHHAYPQVSYVVSWDKALEHLSQATKETEAVNQHKDKNEDLPVLTALRKEPLKKLTEKEKYEFQILCFGAYLANDDLDKKSGPTVENADIIRNRACYKFAFESRNPQDVLKKSLTALRSGEFKSLSSRIKGLRYSYIIHPNDASPTSTCILL